MNKNYRLAAFYLVVLLTCGAVFGCVIVGFSAIPNNTIRQDYGAVMPLFNATGAGYFIGPDNVISAARAATFASVNATQYYLGKENITDFLAYPQTSYCEVWGDGTKFYARNQATGLVPIIENNATLVINTAFSNNDVVVLQNGTYPISGSILMNRVGLQLYGSGRGKSETAEKTGAVLIPQNDKDVIIISQSFCRVEGITIYGDRATRAAGRGIVITSGADKIDLLWNRIMFTSDHGIEVVTGGCNGITIAFNEVREVLEEGSGSTDAAIQCVGLADALITGNQVSSLKTGMYFGSCGNTRITNNDIFPTTYGVYFSSCQRMDFSHNVVEPAVTSLTEYAVFYSSNAGNPWGYYSRFIGNELHTGNKHGFYFSGVDVDYNIIQSNTIRGFTYSGIYLTNGDYNEIVNNMIISCGRPVELNGNSDYNTIKNNQFVSNTNPITEAGTGNVIILNFGYATETSGTTTILNGTTSIVITHGLAYTPTSANTAWTVSYLENPTNDPGSWYIDTFTATQVTIHVFRDPGVSNLDIAWSARRTP